MYTKNKNAHFQRSYYWLVRERNLAITMNCNKWRIPAPTVWTKCNFCIEICSLYAGSTTADNISIFRRSVSYSGFSLNHTASFPNCLLTLAYNASGTYISPTPFHRSVRITVLFLAFVFCLLHHFLVLDHYLPGNLDASNNIALAPTYDQFVGVVNSDFYANHNL